MENKKLIKTIKKKALKKLNKALKYFKSELKDSVITKLYGSLSKKEIKKIRKQILREMQEELLNVVNTIKVDEAILVNTDALELIKDDENTSAEKVEGEELFTREPGKIFEYQGFKFNVDRMSGIVTGKSRDKIISNPGTERVDKATESKEEGAKDSIKSRISQRLSEIKGGDKRDELIKIVTAPNLNYPFPQHIPENRSYRASFIPTLNSVNMVPSTRNFVNTEAEKITPARKEEILFFVGKLKDGIDNLGKGEKNIQYRRVSDEIYAFSFEKVKLDKNDFSLRFNLDLNINTCGAKINTFDFDVDGFKFDKGFVEILDMVKVLDVVGMSLRKYIDEITGINTSAETTKANIKDNLKNNAEAIRANTKLAKFIFDPKILKVLHSNDINTYGQLKRIEDLTALKGIGFKTAEKIEQYIKG